ncbi:PepSY domain-containing protein [Actibacterium sp. D379-3]
MTKFSTRAIALSLALGTLAATGGAALASGYERLKPEQAQQIRTRLQQEGYEVRKIEAEDGMIEVYALKNGMRYELYLDQALNIVRSKQND